MPPLVPPVILRASGQTHSATLIFLHGLGDTGFGWAGALNTIKPPYMKIVCPTANSIPVSLNDGLSMPAWYDIFDLDGIREDLEGLDASSVNLGALIAEEAKEVPRDRILLGGFSQGGALALYHLLKDPGTPLAGGIALSTYLPGDTTSYGPAETPLLQVHGEADEIVTFDRGMASSKILTGLFANYRFKGYPNMGHEGTLEEMDLVKDFIHEMTPDLSKE
eukprot:TRINITY_DN6786_c0_g1_i1.p1 TRINITY_DN6786_c0_g1~~TRINITY_DN6786_c0_g1_i1.p1  ORF type:complete len:221 (+),score=47.45 TRINITY_DN6786_c0_g1_i1:37-699(+)